MWLNNPTHAKVAVKGLQARLHENPLLAAIGVKQYKVYRNKEISATGTVDKASVTLEAAMTAEQYQDTVQNMRAGGLAGASSPSGGDPDQSAGKRPRRTPPAPDPPTKEQKERKEAKEKYDKAVKSMKSTVDRVRKELNDVTLVQRKLEAKAWGKEATGFLKSETASQ
eukprot:3882669-Pyramimonas_sp.AAC.1